MSMMLEPKHIGDDFSLDEYNACQYLLYNSDCWIDSVKLDNFTQYKGKFATYQLKKHKKLITEKNEYYMVNGTIDSSDVFTISVSNLNANLSKLQITVEIVLYYKIPENVIDMDNKSITTDANEIREIYEWSKDELKGEPSQGTELIIPATFSSNKITFNLMNGDEALLPNEAIISKRVEIRYHFNSKPYLDFYNGKANDAEEILVDNVKDLHRLIENAPTNGELTIIRLDSLVNNEIPANAVSDGTWSVYFLEKTITIKDGQNIELRGGSNRNARLNGSIAKRCFVIKPGGKLYLKDISCEHANCMYSEYQRGRGGAILIENDVEKFGILEAYSSSFVSNKAYYGGAIFSYHGGLHLDSSTFLNNFASSYGGAIHYIARDVYLYYKNIITVPEETIRLVVEVKDINGNYKNEGYITFYKQEPNSNVYLGKVLVKNGIAELKYKVPKLTETSEIVTTAIYTGGYSTDDDVATNIIQVNVKEPIKISWVAGNVTQGEVGETVILNAKVTNQQGTILTDPRVVYTIENKTMLANLNGNVYQIKFTLTEEDYKKQSFVISSTILDNPKYECNTITAKLKVTNEDEDKVVDGYTTGLIVPQDTEVTADMVTKWTTAKITDLFVDFFDYSKADSRTTIEKVLELTKDKGFRIHVKMNCFYNESTKSYLVPTNSTRVDFIKKHIDYIAEHYDVKGICLDYLRYQGTDGKNTGKHTTITSKYKEICEYIQNKKKSHLISTITMPEDINSSLIYGQNLSEINQYVDYFIPATLKGNYKKDNEEQTDDWILDKIGYITDDIDINKNKIMAEIQTYKMDTANTVRTKDELTTTARKISTLKIKGIVLSYEGKAPDGYVEDFASINKG